MNKRTLALSLAVMALAILLAGGMGTAAQPLPTQVTPAVPDEPILESEPELTEPTGAEAALALATTRVSVSSAGVEGNNESNYPALSNDGRYVAFSSDASNLVANDTNALEDVFVHDYQTGQTQRISVSSGGQEGNGESGSPAISSTGRYIAFSSFASNLVSGDTNNGSDIFVMDRDTGVIQRVSVSSSEAQTAGGSHDPAISSNGRYIAFYSGAGDLVASDTNDKFDVFVRDTVAGETWLVSVSTGGAQGNHDSWGKVSISGDGRRVGFASWASTLVSNDTNGVMDVFVRDWFSGLTTLASISSGGAFSNGNSSGMISSNGRYVAFGSDGSNLVSGDTNGVSDAFVHDLDTGLTERVTVSASGGQSNGGVYAVDISTGGRLVIFHSSANNLVSNDTNSRQDVFVYDRDYDRTSRVSIATNGTQGNANALYLFDMSGDTRFVAFSSYASNLVANDSNGVLDVFVREFKSCYALTLQKQSGQGDSPQASPAQSIGCEPGTYQPGEQITVTANEADGWHVAGWSGTDNDSSMGLTNAVTMPNNDHTVQVSYSVDCLRLLFGHSGSGSDPVGSPGQSTNCSTNLYRSGEVIELTAFPANGWRVAGWSGTDNDISTATTNTVTMPGGQHTVTVAYALNNTTSSTVFLPSVMHVQSACWFGPSEIEPNNSTDQANGPVCSGRSYQGNYNDVNDYFYIDHVQDGGSFNVILLSYADQDVQLQIRYQHDLIAYDADGSNGYEVALQNPPAGRYHIRVVKLNPSSTLSYTLMINTSLACFTGLLENEPNNNGTQANGPLCPGRTYEAQPDDQLDYFYFETTSAGEIVIDMTNHVYSKVQLLLYYERPDGTPVARDYNASDGSQIRHSGPAGRYYVIVFSDLPPTSTTHYSLRGGFPFAR